MDGARARPPTPRRRLVRPVRRLQPRHRPSTQRIRECLIDPVFDDESWDALIAVCNVSEWNGDAPRDQWRRTAGAKKPQNRRWRRGFSTTRAGTSKPPNLGSDPRRFAGWEPQEVHDHYDVNGAPCGAADAHRTVVTREVEWDEESVPRRSSCPTGVPVSAGAGAGFLSQSRTTRRACSRFRDHLLRAQGDREGPPRQGNG